MASTPPIGPGDRDATLREVQARLGALEALLPDEIRRNSDPEQSIDEVVVRRADVVHLEQMDRRSWWLGISKGNKTLHIRIRASKKGTLTVTVTADELGIRGGAAPEGEGAS